MSNVRPTVMVVEDQVLVNVEVTTFLQDAGFDVVDEDDSDHALRDLCSCGDLVALFTDVNMPGELNGIELAHRARAMYPGLRIIVTSSELTAGSAILPQGSQFLPKPYRCSDVVALIAA